MSQVARRRSGGLLSVLILAVVILPTAGQVQHSPGSRAQGRFAWAADNTFREGVHAKLPPHLSTLLGVSKEEECPVMQSVVRKGNVAIRALTTSSTSLRSERKTTGASVR